MNQETIRKIAIEYIKEYPLPELDKRSMLEPSKIKERSEREYSQVLQMIRKFMQWYNDGFIPYLMSKVLPKDRKKQRFTAAIEEVNNELERRFGFKLPVRKK